MPAITAPLNDFGPSSLSLTIIRKDKDNKKEKEFQSIEAEYICDSDLKKAINIMNNINRGYSSALSIGKIIDNEINSKKIILDIFKESRDFTKKEAQLYKESIDELFNNTGRKLYDI
ncbi:hypothetical protein C8C77_10255 [Halanaerobium saccharolyticum]|uniref:Uncharacterized protein n=1 Tax=Halanaerobium saccharolyticum TaxID=43595 RepID=A0A4R7Z8D0_9FIRM|nr:hypothetical protein [Halanaerobium saccharolyticum]RAK08602.1 hypothetical protein C7958_10939 [Halanaerobium saccharolyticum]TDW07255.1 hypothetical protein C8C77_10255 [Halanaerobium saccharolyticum]TDX60154.1 hypothetical protein C7956_11039 [Halanaerobium saccharolyticum]